MEDPKQTILNLIADIEKGTLPPDKAWDQIRKLKEKYVEQLEQQSWNSFIGHRFQSVIHLVLKAYVKKLKAQRQDFKGLDVLTEAEAKHNEVIFRKLAVRYGDFLLLPDVDSTIVWIDPVQKWESKILAIISCKTSLRERIAQACYWKLKLVDSDVQKGIRVFLATADNDNDFDVGDDQKRFGGKSRDRIISEHELDGIYILKENFSTDWESPIVKRFDRIFEDIIAIIKQAKNI
jgi:hypothetical protein